MMRIRSLVRLFAKTGAFIGSLLSVAVLTLSVLVLVSSLSAKQVKESVNGTSTEGPLQFSTPSITLPIPIGEDLCAIIVNETTSQTPCKRLEDDTSTTTTAPASPVIPPTPSPSSLSSTTTEEVKTSLEEDGVVVESSVNDNNNTSGSSTLPLSTSPTSLTASSEPEPKAEPLLSSFFSRQRDLWKDKSDTYIILIQASSGTGVFAGFLQLCFSWLLICGSGKGLKERIGLWSLSNFTVIILLFVVILMPFSYNNATDTFKTGSVFWRDVRKTVGGGGSLRFSQIFDALWTSAEDFLRNSLKFYYCILGMNCFILSVFIVPPLVFYFYTGCRKCCCRRRKYDPETESDLMLFEKGGDPFRHYS